MNTKGEKQPDDVMRDTEFQKLKQRVEHFVRNYGDGAGEELYAGQYHAGQVLRLIRRLEKVEQRVLEVEIFGLNRMTELQKLHTENATLRAALESAPPNYYGWDQDASRDEYNQWLVIRAKALEPKK